jgi:alcohol dehydrogenase class IV
VSCRHLVAIEAGCETAFTVDASRVTFGRGALAEVGPRAAALGVRRAMVVTDENVRALPWFDDVARSLAAAGIDAAVFDAVAIEPTDASFEAAAAFARDARVDGYVSLGGGSVIDTAKAANLLATHPAPLRAYVNAPLGDARPPPGPLAPHVACPTTSGTGSEVTGIAIFDDVQHHAKTGIASPRLRPSEAVVDPRVTATLPAAVVAASGMDVLCHALESFTARAFSRRATTGARPMSQGANPWSDVGCREALALAHRYLRRAVAGDADAREQMMWAATLAGIAFGNAGVHVPHAMAYAIAGRARGFAPAGYPRTATSRAGDHGFVPHGMAVTAGAPAAFAALGAHAPARHLEAAALLGADTRGAAPDDAGALLAGAVRELARAIDVPASIADVGYTAADVADLVAGTLPQRRLLANAPADIDADCLHALFTASLSCPQTAH